jgi:hypothetical protein
MHLRTVPTPVFEQLAQNLWQAKAFEDALTAVLTADRWDLRALAGPELPAERLENIKWGWLERGGPTSRDVAEVAVVEMRRLADAGFISIDALLEPRDPGLEVHGVPVAVVGGGTMVYTASDAEIELVEAAWRMAITALGAHIALVTTHPLPHGDDPAYDVAAAVGAATMMIFEAYDGQGALVLTRRTPASARS